MFSLQGKTAIITGAGSGIGKATAIIFAKQGAHVFALDMNEDAVKAVCDEITAAGGTATYKQCDITNSSQIKEITSDVVSTNKTVDVLVNCAGIAHIGKADNTEEADFDRLVNVNIKGIYNCLYHIIPCMKEKGGAIINLASIASSVGLSDRFAYSTTKGAVIGMTLSVAKDYIGYNIRCNCISPARVHTPFVDGFIAKNYPGKEAEMFEKLSKTQPIGRMAKPEEIAGLALYLASDEASFVTGSDYPIDGGFITLNS